MVQSPWLIVLKCFYVIFGGQINGIEIFSSKNHENISNMSKYFGLGACRLPESRFGNNNTLVV